MPQIVVDFDPQPNFRRPEILLHPPVPAALRGVAPRIIKGQDWWDSVRFDVYKENNYCCWACGEHADPIDAHEAYSYDVETMTASLEDVQGLCRSCHKYIHSIMTYAMYLSGKRSSGWVVEILERGINILHRAGLEPHPITAAIHHKLSKRLYLRTVESIVVKEFDYDVSLWNKWTVSNEWRLVLDGEEYDYFSDPVREARMKRRLDAYRG